MDPAPGDKIRFTKFDNGQIEGMEGEIVEITQSSIMVSHNSIVVAFRRAPGPKAGWGIGPAKSWRIGSEERKKLCHQDTSRRR